MFQDGPVGRLPPATWACDLGRARCRYEAEPRRFQRTQPPLTGPAGEHALRRAQLPAGHGGVPTASLPTISGTLHSLFKVLFIFPSQYLFAIGLVPVFSLRRDLPPALGCIPKQPDSPKARRQAAGTDPTGLSPSLAVSSNNTWGPPAADHASPDYNSLREAQGFSRWALPGSLAATRGILVSFFSSAY